MMKAFRWLAVATVVGISIGSAFASEPSPQDETDNDPAPEVHVVGVYEGTYPEGVRRQGGLHPDGSATVKVRGLKKRAVLVLTSYEPIAWTIEDPDKVITRVIASGYHGQKVQGLDEKVPVTLLGAEPRERRRSLQLRTGILLHHFCHDRNNSP